MHPGFSELKQRTNTSCVNSATCDINDNRMCSKDDFLDWDELDLDILLVEYTDYDDAFTIVHNDANNFS